MKRDDAEGLVVLAAVGVGGWLLYQIFQTIKTVGTGAAAAATAAGNAVGGSIYQTLHPNAAGASVTYIATLPDGTKTAVNNNALDSNNYFTVGNQTYQLNQGAPGTGNTATPVIDPSASDPNAIDFSVGNF
jgi:hypothetical protein